MQRTFYKYLGLCLQWLWLDLRGMRQYKKKSQMLEQELNQSKPNIINKYLEMFLKLLTVNHLGKKQYKQKHQILELGLNQNKLYTASNYQGLCHKK